MNQHVKDGFTGMAVSEERIQAVMRALDIVLDDPDEIHPDWNSFLRTIAIRAIEAGKVN